MSFRGTCAGPSWLWIEVPLKVNVSYHRKTRFAVFTPRSASLHREREEGRKRYDFNWTSQTFDRFLYVCLIIWRIPITSFIERVYLFRTSCFWMMRGKWRFESRVPLGMTGMEWGEREGRKGLWEWEVECKGKEKEEGEESERWGFGTWRRRGGWERETH